MDEHDCKKEFGDIYWNQAKIAIPSKFDDLQDALGLAINVVFGLGAENFIRSRGLGLKMSLFVGAISGNYILDYAT